MRVLIDHGSLFLDAAHELVVIGSGDVVEHEITGKEIGCDLHE